MVLGLDSEFNVDRMIETVNTELANNIGNISSRLIKMVGSYFDNVIPSPVDEDDDDRELREKAQDVTKLAIGLINDLKVDKALYELNILMNAVNSYLEANAPWKLAKDESKRDKLSTILYYCVETLRITSILLYPVMPDKMKIVLENLGEKCPPMIENTEWGKLQTGLKIKKLPTLFPRIDIKKIVEQQKKADSQKAKSSSKKKAIEPEGVKFISYDDFAKLELRVAEIKEAVKAENADKLLLLKIDVGEENLRNLVAGIAKWYSPEDLIGKKIIIIANLKPAKIRGNISQGMLLAADNGDDVVVLTLDRDLPVGSKVR